MGEYLLLTPDRFKLDEKVSLIKLNQNLKNHVKSGSLYRLKMTLLRKKRKSNLIAYDHFEFLKNKMRK